jgi:predicted oxidoreductase (fatty acid repression mutant protein)
MLNSAFNAQVSRVIIIVVQVAVKIYVAATEALRIKERQNETQFCHQIWWKN